MATVYGYPKLGLAGRLGNQLWEVAATVSMARRHGCRAWVPGGWEYRDYLSLPEDVYEPPVRGRDELVDVAGLPGGPYFQELDHIAAVRDELSAWYAPSAWGRERLEQAHGGALTWEWHLTAVHVRRGDYVEHSDRFPPLTPRYYRDALDLVREAHPDTTVLVFSDDIPWCRANADEWFGPETTSRVFVEGHVRPIPPRERVGEPADVYDLWLQARCDAHVIANSSFSWWSAFLSEQKQVLYPDRWFGDPALFDTMWRCIPEGWGQIAC